jgi:hypothetical protein
LLSSFVFLLFFSVSFLLPDPSSNAIEQSLFEELIVA